MQIDVLERDARLQAAILIVDGLPPESDGALAKAAAGAYATWRPDTPGKEGLLVVIDKAGRRMVIATGEGLKARLRPGALDRLSEAVNGDALRVGDLDGAVAGVLRGLNELAGKGKAGADGERPGAGPAVKVERVDGLVAVPALTRPVTDLTATLLASETDELEARLQALKAQTGVQFAVLLTPTTLPEAIEPYSMRVVEAWKLGQEKRDNGALLLVAKDDRKMRIEVGYGLEGALNDATARRIIGDLIAPRFKTQDYFGGIQAGIEAMAEAVRGEPAASPNTPAPDDLKIEDTLAFWIATLLGLALSVVLRGRMSLRQSAALSALAGAGSGAILGLFAGGPLFALMSAIPIYLGAHLPRPVAGRTGVRLPSTSSSWPGSVTESASSSSWGTGSSDSGGSVSDSGYAGGGGKFGGGGASGSW